MPKKDLKHNPKIDEKSKSKTGSSYKKEVDSYNEKHYHNRLYMILVFIGVIAIITTLILVVFNSGGVRIKQYDLVRLDYKIYSEDEYINHQEPSIEEINTWVNVCSRYDEKCKNGLIKGFYYELLGKRVGDYVNYKYIEKCRDLNWDGYNDLDPTKEALSFGNSTDLLYDTNIILTFKIYEINSSSSTETQAAILTWQGKEIINCNHNCFNYFIVTSKKELDFFS